VYGVALARVERDQQAAAANDAVSRASRDLDLAFEDGDPGPLVHLMIVQALACRNH
jgi:hypothetical protein